MRLGRLSSRALVTLLLVGVACVVLALVLGPDDVVSKVLGAGGIVVAGGSALALKRRV